MKFRTVLKQLAGASIATTMALGITTQTMAASVALQEGTAIRSQTNFSVDTANDGVYALGNVAGAGWANNAEDSNIAVFETVSNLVLDSNVNTLRLNLFAGGFSTSHTIGKYRLSYTTDDRSTFADGADNAGDVIATWNVITPTSVISSGGATLTVQPDGSILASGANPALSTDTVYVTLGKQAAPITGFRIEAIEDPSFTANGPGRSTNGNFVLREFDVAAFSGDRVALQNGTAQFSQGGFSVDNIVNGDFDFEQGNNPGWADFGSGSTGNTASNVATFETTADIRSAKDVVVEIVSGGFGTHTLGRFRLAVTDADRSLFADGNDNGGAGVGAEPIWTVVDIDSIVSDNAGTIFTELGDLSILSSGTPGEFEHYTINFTSPLETITGFRLEAIEDASLPQSGPGRGSNGNYVVREFSVFAATIPEPTSMILLLGGVAAGVTRRRRA